LVGIDGGAVTTEGCRTVIGGRVVAPVEAAPEVDGGLAVVFDVGFAFGLNFGLGVTVVWAVTA
jgi:hypothetical protein